MELYRQASVGMALTDALDEMVATQQISPALEDKVKRQFDISVGRVLKSSLSNKVKFKAKCKHFNKLESIHSYRFSEMTFELEGKTKLDTTGSTRLVACDINAV